MIFETHAHYDDEAFNEDREAVIKSLAAAGVETVVNIGASMDSSETTLELTRNYPFIYGTAGVHPSWTDELNEEKFQRLREIIKEPKMVAVGEIGLTTTIKSRPMRFRRSGLSASWILPER